MVDPEGAADSPVPGSRSERDAADEERWRQAMRDAQTGDEASYRVLLTELLPVVRRQVRSRISAPSDAEDVVQNALIAIHRGRHTYQAERPFGPWMRTVVRHCVIDWFRERGRRANREVAVESPELFADPVEAEEPGSQELSPPLVAALEALPAKQREAVELIHLHGLSVAEASLRAGVTPGALKVRAHRGYKALRARLAGVEGIR
jgi:RNA polymerase sigma-70 factor (ECF subfamily)